MIVSSLDPDAKYFPSGENTIMKVLVPALRILIISPFDTFHKTIQPSSDPDAKYFPFGENVTLFIISMCP